MIATGTQLHSTAAVEVVFVSDAARAGTKRNWIVRAQSILFDYREAPSLDWVESHSECAVWQRMLSPSL